MSTLERSDSLYNDWVIAQCDQQPNAIAVHDLHSNRVMSYTAFNDRVESLSSGLSHSLVLLLAIGLLTLGSIVATHLKYLPPLSV